MDEPHILEPQELQRAIGGNAGGGADTFWWSSPPARVRAPRGPVPLWRGLADVAIGAGKAIIYGAGIGTIGLETADLLKAKAERHP